VVLIVHFTPNGLPDFNEGTGRAELATCGTYIERQSTGDNTTITALEAPRIKQPG
jgi:hypothetical protein